jgi:very-short-patch-repair endonuclease
MSNERTDVALARVAKRQHGAFTRAQAAQAGLSEAQIQGRITRDAWVCVLPGVYRAAGTPETRGLQLTAALLWAGPTAVVFGSAAAELWPMQVVARKPEIVVATAVRRRSAKVVVHRSDDRAALQVCRRDGFPVTSAAATLVALAATVDATTLEDAFESARRHRIVTVSSMRRYLDVYGRRGVRGAAPMRTIVDAVDPTAPSRSRLEVLTRQLLVAHGITNFVREYPMSWNGRTYYFDFAFARQRVILETNGRTWHADPSDYERDNEKWSVPGRYGWRIVFATWEKVTDHPRQLLEELDVALAA